MYTFGELKRDIRPVIWPEGEAANLVVAHDKFFVDALIDLQSHVVCLQRDNHDLFPQCATLYRCGVTSFDKPRGNVLSVSVIDKINPDTGLEDPDSPDDWCSDIPYRQIEPCHVRSYLRRSELCGCCLPATYYFGLAPSMCAKAAYPIPTDEGVPAGLAPLPLGYHYPQESTDRTYGRALAGVWAIEANRILVIPWIQSTETVVVKWEGIKRKWNDSDPIDDDPLLLKAVEEWVRNEVAGKENSDQLEMARASSAYAGARQLLWHQCREETRVRECTPMLARGSSFGTGTLYFNDEQSATATCQDGQTGDPVSVTIPAGTVGSNVSVADANRKAKEQAETQAQAQLVCTTQPETFTNNVPGDYTASCVGESGAPTPDGAPVRVVIPVGTVSGATQAAANAAAQAQAEASARAQLRCTFWNREKSATAHCTSNPGQPDITVTKSARSYSSTVSQAQADELAQTAAQNEANAQMEPLCPGDAASVYNTAQQIMVSAMCQCRSPIAPYPVTSGQIRVLAVMAPGTVSGADQQQANLKAIPMLTAYANAQLANLVAFQARCGLYNGQYPDPIPPL